MNPIALSADAGLAALGCITLNLALGLLIAMRYSPRRCWPHRRINLFRLHNLSGYAVLAVSVLHPSLLLLASHPRFRVLDLVYPLHSPSQPLENTIGAIALYGIAIVVVTSYFRLRLGRRLWKALHFVIYAAALALFWHSLFTDPHLQNTPLNPFDGEKVFVELCCLAIVVFSGLRWRYAMRKPRARAESKEPRENAVVEA